MAARAEVDFNSRDEHGNIPIDRSDVEGLVAVGDWIDLFDDEGNRCIGVVAIVGEEISVRPEWPTFTSASDSRVVVEAAAYWHHIDWIGRTSVSFTVDDLPREAAVDETRTSQAV